MVPKCTTHVHNALVENALVSILISQNSKIMQSPAEYFS